MNEHINKIDEKIKYIQGEIKELSRYNSRLIPSSFQANKVRGPQSESTYYVFFYTGSCTERILLKQVNLLDVQITSISWGDPPRDHLLTQSLSRISFTVFRIVT